MVGVNDGHFDHVSTQSDCNKKKKFWLVISLNSDIAKLVWCIETLLGIANNENLIRKNQEVCSFQSIRKELFLLQLLYFPEILPKLVEHSVCCYQDASPCTLSWVLFSGEPENFLLFHALHKIYPLICNRLEHQLRHETDQNAMTETISFDFAHCFWCFWIDGLHWKIDKLLLQNQHMWGALLTFVVTIEYFAQPCKRIDIWRMVIVNNSTNFESNFG